jgi:endogenous inhibitor of DNA gyrase (YacG/DUF329 family)
MRYLARMKTFLIVALLMNSVPALAATYKVVRIEKQSLTRGGRALGDPTISCVPRGVGNVLCGATIEVHRSPTELILINKSATASQELESFMMEGTVISPKCKKRVARMYSMFPFASGLCRATYAESLSDGEKVVFTFFRNTENPQQDADNAAFWTGLLLGLPIGYGSATKVTIPAGDGVPPTITVQQQRHLGIGQVHETFHLVQQ